MPPTYSEIATTSTFSHTHSSHNLTLPNSKKSPISHIDDFESDSYAFFRFIFILLLLGLGIGIWLTIKFRSNARRDYIYGSNTTSAAYKPLRVDDMLDISSDDSDEDDVVLKLAG